MAFDLQPADLRGALVALRPLRPDDFDALFAAASDRLIWEQHPASDRYTQPVFRKYFDGAIASGGAFLVSDSKTGEIIGCSRYHDLNEAESRVEIGFTFLIRSRWGGAYNGELKRLMLDHAFRFVETVVFTAGPTNFRSRRALEKIGAVLQGPGVNSNGDACVVFHLHRP
ncbi:MAG TPA: GNAT family N-acetyltransferase [Terriglobales bacterium]|nr:GNAT family N-acetyltransferase [Terriglobales bacterium]